MGVAVSDIAYFHNVRARIAERMFGVDDIINSLLIALICRGHVLLEGNPGLGKTVLVKSLRDALDLGRESYGRIQFTPDLMPSDITGTERPTSGSGFQLEFARGPIFCELLLADEIKPGYP